VAEAGNAPAPLPRLNRNQGCHALNDLEAQAVVEERRCDGQEGEARDTRLQGAVPQAGYNQARSY
jgi:hypothetical protein